MTTATATASPRIATPLRAGPAIAPSAFRDVCRQLVLRHAKWDPQVGDVATLAAFPLLLRRSHWIALSMWAEALATEAMAAEQELLARPALHRRLGVPWAVRRALARRAGSPADGPRLIRFDFHWTGDGWRISEANTDVPGGLCEASAFGALMAQHVPNAWPAGDPAARWADAIASVATGGLDVAMVTATGFMEDHQVMAHLAHRLVERGLRPRLVGPGNVRWSNGIAALDPAFGAGPLGAVVRFVQAEWLPRPGRAGPWARPARRC